MGSVLVGGTCVGGGAGGLRVETWGSGVRQHEEPELGSGKSNLFKNA